jgi:N-methylhydantoinase A
VSGYAIGIDVGGTFTDIVCVAEDGTETLAKAPTTPADQSQGVLDGLGVLAERLGLALPELLARTGRIVHGTTVATNALLEKRVARAAMLTTEGHRDVIEMREGTKPDRYDLRSTPPAPIIPRARRLPVRERMGADGAVRVPLDPASLDAAIARLDDAEAVAICFLHAWANPAHEQRAAAAVRAARPEAYVTLSSEVLPQIKEFERFSTTAVNAAVGPLVARYLTRLASRLSEAGYAGPLFVILSHGGVAPVEDAARLAAGTALSGPAGGVAAAVALARGGAGEDLVTFDMGGTSSDIALIQRGEAALGHGRDVGGERIALESLDISTLGAGGGSIAHLDAAGRLAVGPRSAGADPGPVAYGRGGTEPTVTDANLVLGLLDPARFLGGRRVLDAEAARAALARLGQRLGLSAEQAAAGVQRLVDAKMADGIRIATVRRGVDPRRAALLAFGGAAGLHASAVARDLGMRRVLVPLFAAGLSAWGMLRTDLRFELSRSLPAGMPEEDALRAVFAELAEAVSARMAAWHGGAVTLVRSADLRYGEQVYDVRVPLDGVGWDEPGLTVRIEAAFHARHDALFGWSRAGEEVVLVNARVAAIGRLPEARAKPLAAGADAPPVARRRILLDGGRHEVPVFDFAALAPGQRIAGPAIVESDTTTVLLRPGDQAGMHASRLLEIVLP